METGTRDWGTCKCFRAPPGFTCYRVHVHVFLFVCKCEDAIWEHQKRGKANRGPNAKDRKQGVLKDCTCGMQTLFARTPFTCPRLHAKEGKARTGHARK